MFPSPPTLNTSSIHCLTCICAFVFSDLLWCLSAAHSPRAGRMAAGAAGRRARAGRRGGGAGRLLPAARPSAAGGSRLAAGAFFKVSAANGRLVLIPERLSLFRQKQRGAQIWGHQDWLTSQGKCLPTALSVNSSSRGCSWRSCISVPALCWPVLTLSSGGVRVWNKPVHQPRNCTTVQINKSQSILVQIHIKFMCKSTLNFLKAAELCPQAHVLLVPALPQLHPCLFHTAFVLQFSRPQSSRFCKLDACARLYLPISI